MVFKRQESRAGIPIGDFVNFFFLRKKEKAPEAAL